MNSTPSLIGNERRRAELARDLDAGKLGHAYLFAGPAEVGKCTAARLFGEQILMREATDTSAIQQQLRANTCPLFTTVDRLWIDGVAEDWEQLAQSSNFNQIHRSKTPKAKTDKISLADLTEILGRIHQAHEGWHVVLIRRVERMTREAANAFLKTLEEPPPRTVFLLTTDSIALLLPTISSRCRVMQFGNVDTPSIEARLTELHPAMPAEERSRIATFALGKPGRAIRLAADPEALTAQGDYFRRLKTLFSQPDTLTCLRFAEEASKTVADTQHLLEALTYFLRSFLLSRARSPERNSRYTVDKLTSLLRATRETSDLVHGNVNARLALETLLLQI